MTVKTKCVTNIKEALGDKFTRAEVDEIVQSVIDMADRNPALTKSFAQKLKLAARELSEADVLAAQAEKRQRAINIIAENKAWDRISSSRRKASAELHAMNVGDTTGEVRGGDSLDARAHALEGTWLGAMIVDLRKAKVLHRLTGRGLVRRRDVAFERDVSIEMSRLNGGRDAATGNHEAVQVATILNKYGENARVSRNKAGAFIGKRRGFIVAQTHDAAKVSRVKQQEWINFIAPLLDEQTFAGVTDRAKFLKKAYVALATGVHLGIEKGKKGGFSFVGPGNIAKRLSHQRVLHFKTAADWFTYNERFGLGNVYEGALFNLRRAARDTVTMQTYGVNPEAMFTKLVNKAMRRAEEAGDLQEMERLKSGLEGKGGLTPGLREEFEAAIGVADIPGNPRAAEFMQGIRNWVAMAKLGGMVLASFPDIGTRAMVLRNNGVGLLEGLGNGIKSMMRGRGSEEMQDAANTIGVGVDGMLGATLARFSAVDNVPGKASKMLGHFFRLNLASWWQDSMSIGVGNMLSHNLARRVGATFDALPARLQQTFTRYGITADDWNVIRAAQTKSVEGRMMLFADDIADKALATKLQTYFVDQSREALTMGGAAERAWTTQFGAPGSLPGEMARFALQFKNYPLTFARRHLGGYLRRGDYGGLATLIVLTTVLGFAARAAKDIAAGKEPSVDFGAALAQGGGLGIYGDFLLGEYDRFGRTLGEVAAGPTVSLVSDWAGIFTKIAKGGLTLEGDPGKIASQFVKTAVDSTPFMNLFYTRAALDYLILFQVQEMLDPGALKKREKRIERENNQRFIIPPSSAIPHGGGDRIFEGVR